MDLEWLSGILTVCLTKIHIHAHREKWSELLENLYRSRKLIKILLDEEIWSVSLTVWKDDLEELWSSGKITELGISPVLCSVPDSLIE